MGVLAVRIWVLSLGLVACIEPQLIPCGDRDCSPSDVCTPGGCASPANVAACSGLADGSACKTSAGVGGACVGGSCQTGLCGNCIVDPGEACDDCNTVSGDGCTGDCKKVEVCGDGVVDVGEACDDGNSNPVDGCDACGITSWHATTLIGGNANATSVGFLPSAIAVDRSGNIFIADGQNNVIRRVDTTGVITTVAGAGAAGFSGDGGRATSAQLNGPQGIAVDGRGILFISDTANQRIRRVDLDGVITTIAGDGTYGYSGDGSAATSAQLRDPLGIAVDGLGTIYVADTDNNRIRQIDAAGIITTVAGTGTAGGGGDGGPATSADLAQPSGVLIDAQGDLVIADTNNQRVRRVDAMGTITTIAGTGTAGFSGDGGPATAAELYSPVALALDPQGGLVIADIANERVRRIDPGGTITTIAGTGTVGASGDGGPAIDATFDLPVGVAVDAFGDVFVADVNNHRVRRIDPSGTIATIAGTDASVFTGDGGPATTAWISPAGVAITGTTFYIVDNSDNRIRRVDGSGIITTIAGNGAQGFSGDGGPATSAALYMPLGAAADGAGNVYVADAYNYRIRKIDPSGIITTVAGTGGSGFSGDGGPAISAKLRFPNDVAVDAAGTLYISDSDNNRIRRVDSSGIITTVAGTGTAGYGGDGGPATSAALNWPHGIALDGAGNLYIADLVNSVLRRVDPAGTITTVAGTPGSHGVATGDGGPATSAVLQGPVGVAVDAAGNLYITGAMTIRRIDTAGVITTVAGSGTFGPDGDGGPALAAQFYMTSAIAAAPDGTLYIADQDNGRIRRVAGGVITTAAGQVDPNGVGLLAQARLADPRAFVVAPTFSLFAAGSSGTLQAARPTQLEVAVGRYPQVNATGVLARFRDQSFGDVAGVAYDAAAGVIYLTESTANRIHAVTVVDPADVNTWTIASLANAAGTTGFRDGAAQTAQFRNPTGLYLDPVARVLYVADTGNHAIRAIDLSAATVTTIAGTPATLGFFGDGGAATSALLFEPRAITRCANGDLFIADTGNNRVRRVAGPTGAISTVLGDGTAASSGEGLPARTFPVNAPLGLACDAIGNVFVTSTTTVRLLTADPSGIVDGSGAVETIYGAAPRTQFPASVTSCLTGIVVVDAVTIEVTDSCTGLLVELQRGPS